MKRDFFICFEFMSFYTSFNFLYHMHMLSSLKNVAIGCIRTHFCFFSEVSKRKSLKGLDFHQAVWEISPSLGVVFKGTRAYLLFLLLLQESTRHLHGCD